MESASVTRVDNNMASRSVCKDGNSKDAGIRSSLTRRFGTGSRSEVLEPLGNVILFA